VSSEPANGDSAQPLIRIAKTLVEAMSLKRDVDRYIERRTGKAYSEYGEGPEVSKSFGKRKGDSGNGIDKKKNTLVNTYKKYLKPSKSKICGNVDNPVITSKTLNNI